MSIRKIKRSESVPLAFSPRGRAQRLRAVIFTLALVVACFGLGAPSTSAVELNTRSDHDPIIFVHGFDAASDTWNTMVSRFLSDGWRPSELFHRSYSWRAPNGVTARQIAVGVDQVLAATGATKVDLITHSMGALSTRYYLRNLGGAAKVDAWVSLAGPNHGTDRADACPRRSNIPSCQELETGSQFLRALNQGDETPGAVRYGTWAATDDSIVPNGVALDGATNVITGPLDRLIPDAACLFFILPGDAHCEIHEDGQVYEQVRDFVHPGPGSVFAWGDPVEAPSAMVLTLGTMYVPVQFRQAG